MSGILGGIAGNLAGGNIGRAVVSLVLDTTGYNAQLEKAKVETTASTDTMAAGATKFSGAVVAGAAVAGAAIADFAVHSVTAAIAAQESQDKLANSIQNSGNVTAAAIPAFEDQAKAIEALTGVDNDAINGMQGFLVQMGLTQDQVTALSPLVVDLSQKMGVSLDTAAKAVGKSVNGTSSSLSRMGIVVDKTAEATNSYQATLSALGRVQGFAAQKADAEPWIKLHAAFLDLEQAVGQTLLPVLQDIVPIMTDFANSVAPLLEENIKSTLQPLADFASALSYVNNLLPQGAQATSAYGAATHAAFTGEFGSVFSILGKYNDFVIHTGDTLLHNVGILHDHADATTTDAQAQQHAANVLAGLGPKYDAETRAVNAAVAASQKHAQALRDERAAEEQLTGGLIGLIGDQESLNSATQAANKLREQGKQGTLAYHDAVASVLSAQQQFNQDLHTQAQEMRQQGIPLADIKDRLEGIGKQAGLTKAEVDKWISGMQGAKGLLDEITSKTHVVNVQVNVSQAGVGLPPAIQQELQRLLAKGF